MIRARRPLTTAALLAATALTLAACSPGADDPGGESGTDGDGTTVTFRLWDEVAAEAYETSFEEFSAQHPDITVEVEVIPWGDYWTQLPLDVQSGDMADIFWTNTSNFGTYADNGTLLDIDETLGEDHDEWEQSVVDLYTRDGVNYGVPQLWDSIALFYNADLVEEAGIDVADLQWRPDAADGDTLLEAATALTTDAEGRHPGDDGFDADARETYGFNSQADLQAIYVDFLAQNGAQFQDPETDGFAFDSPEGVEAFQYLVDLVNTHQVAPSAADTNVNGDFSRDLFVQGDLGLFQSGPYSLPHVAENAEFEWGLAPMVAGPEGRIGVVHGVAAVGNAESENLEATTEVLRWIGSAEGQAPLGETGAAFPGAVDAQQSYIDYWSEQGVDVSVFVDAAQEPTAPSPVGAQINAGANVITPIFQDMFLGAIPVEEALAQAQEDGNAEMGIE
ncbi:ABC transporter substrate-binding protein [Georgenia sp. Z1491]|uniref:ABC transporter substrate-binding protein n=1 Tax=Georgenia sp. Z1491 TaxID=3416707 RepID=UPI003CE6EBF2